MKIQSSVAAFLVVLTGGILALTAAPALAADVYRCPANPAKIYNTLAECENVYCGQSCEKFTVDQTTIGGTVTDGSDAAPTGSVTPGFQERRLENPLSPTGEAMDLNSVIARVIRLMTGVVGGLALLMFIYGCFLLLTSAGNDSQVKKGKEVIFWSVGGLAVILTAYTILKFVFQTLGV